MSHFDDVLGQDEAVVALEAQLARTGGAGATLVVGPDGVGRFRLAAAAARAILGDAALVDAGNHPDFRVLDPEEGIDGVRDAAEALQRKPARGPRQVLVARDADRMTAPAHNAFLKTLEEPPAGAAVFFIAEDVSLLPETVVSRCRVVRARPLDDDATARVLERIGLPPDAARDAGGSPGRAVYQVEAGVREDADRLHALLLEPHADALATADELARKRKDEDLKALRRRLREVLSVVAGRLRRSLPETGDVLRSVVRALGSLSAHANAGIVLAELVLEPWRRRTPPA